MKLKTKVLSLIMAVTMFASVAAMAAPTWKFSGYDLSNGNPYAILEYEVDEKGLPTGNARRNGFASTVEWKHSFYEATYPHMGYSQLYLDGKAQNSYVKTAVANSEQEYRPIYWEAKSPYGVYDVMYSRIPGVMNWTVQPAEVKFGNRNADVKKSWEAYGFSAFDTCYGAFVDSSDFLKALGASRFENEATYSDVVESYNNLWALDGKIQDKGFEINFNIPRVAQEQLVGPKYDNGYVSGTKTVKAVEAIENDFSSANWYNEDILTSAYRKAEVEWVYGGYEKSGLNSMYEVAKIDGILMDGTSCYKLAYNEVIDAWLLVPAKKPYIARYTGGTANPDVQWKAVWVDEKDPYNVYERKMVRDNEGNMVWTDEYRVNNINPDIKWVPVWEENAYPFSVYERKMVKDSDGNMVWTNEYRPTGEYAKILPSFILTSSDPKKASRELKLTFTTPLIPDFDLEKLVGTDYDYVDSNVVVFNGEKVPAFQNTVINYNASL